MMGESKLIADLPDVEGRVERWSLGESIGDGRFGVVLRQKDGRGNFRAVKKLNHDILTAMRIDLSQELNTAVKLNDVSSMKLTIFT